MKMQSPLPPEHSTAIRLAIQIAIDHHNVSAALASSNAMKSEDKTYWERQLAEHNQKASAYREILEAYEW